MQHYVNPVIRFVLVLLFVSLPAVPAYAVDPPLVAIIIDDLGNDLGAGRQALSLRGKLTYSILPGTPYAKVLADQVTASGREAMLHLPMQSLGNNPLGPRGLTRDMTQQAFRRNIIDSIQSLPNVVGINNHMGSLLTSDEVLMSQLMEVMGNFPQMYFLDSRTNDRTVAEQVARNMGVPTTRRDVFLDNERSEQQIAIQFERLLRMARISGSAVAIGHPYPETLAILETKLRELESEGVMLVSVSEIINHQRRNRQWQESSYPLQTAARNLKR